MKIEVELQVMSDAAASIGYGIYFQGHWCVEQWPQAWEVQGFTRDLTMLKFFPILLVI